MTTIEMAIWGVFIAPWLIGAGALLVSFCWTYGNFLAHDRINSILNRREMEQKQSETVKFNPKRNA